MFMVFKFKQEATQLALYLFSKRTAFTSNLYSNLCKYGKGWLFLTEFCIETIEAKSEN